MIKQFENYLILLEFKIILSDKGTLLNRVLILKRHILYKIYEVLK
jgi:hypothetical protein